jgi:hypothetical protein
MVATDALANRRRKPSRRAFVDATLAGIPIEPHGLDNCHGGDIM